MSFSLNKTSLKSRLNIYAVSKSVIYKLEIELEDMLFTILIFPQHSITNIFKHTTAFKELRRLFEFVNSFYFSFLKVFVFEFFKVLFV